MSVPTCDAGEVGARRLLQVLVAGLACAPPCGHSPTEFEVDEMLAWPPTPRAHTPPPG